MGTMTIDQLLAAINAVGITAEQLTMVLSFAAALVEREKLRAAIAKERAAQAAAVQASETTLQQLQQQFEAIDAALAAQA